MQDKAAIQGNFDKLGGTGWQKPYDDDQQR